MNEFRASARCCYFVVSPLFSFLVLFISLLLVEVTVIVYAVGTLFDVVFLHHRVGVRIPFLVGDGVAAP